jgi:hypothetical protein
MLTTQWGVFYTQIQGLPYIYPRIYGFSTTQTGLIYITMCIGSLTGFGFNFLQDAIYRRKVAKHGVEARLYAPMAGGVALFVGCMIFAFTVRPDVHWMGPAVAIVIIIGESAFISDRLCCQRSWGMDDPTMIYACWDLAALGKR